MVKIKNLIIFSILAAAVVLLPSCQNYVGLSEYFGIQEQKKDKNEKDDPQEVSDNELTEIFKTNLRSENIGEPLDVEVMIQDQLTAGCEPTAAAMAIKYMSKKMEIQASDRVTPTFFSDNFLVMEDSFFTAGEQFFGPDPMKVFAGDPRKGYFGCFAPALKTSADNCLLYLNAYYGVQMAIASSQAAEEAVSSRRTPRSRPETSEVSEEGEDGEEVPVMKIPEIASKDITGASLDQLLLCVDNGIPVIVWASLDMQGIDRENTVSWRIVGETEDFIWPKNEHVLLLKGYSEDKNTLYFNDPLKGSVSYSKTDFLRDFADMGNQALIIYRNEREVPLPPETESDDTSGEGEDDGNEEENGH